MIVQHNPQRHRSFGLSLRLPPSSFSSIKLTIRSPSSHKRPGRRPERSKSRPTRSLRLKRWVFGPSPSLSVLITFIPPPILPILPLLHDPNLQAKIVRQESLAIDAQYEKKRKQAEVGWKM